MVVNRREFSLGLAFALTAACSTGDPSRAEPARGLWRVYRQRFLDPSGRIVDTGNGGISHSEGQGYGMLLAALSEDREAFAAMARWADATLARQETGLYAWRYDPRQPNPVADPNNATDGDILIAWALALAGKRWNMPAYSTRSGALRQAIRRDCVVEQNGQSLLLPGLNGFVNGPRVTVNPSYYIWPALDAFARVDGHAIWEPVIASGEELIRQARFGPLQLPTDWVVVTPGLVAPAADKPGVRTLHSVCRGAFVALAIGLIGCGTIHQPAGGAVSMQTAPPMPPPATGGQPGTLNTLPPMGDGQQDPKALERLQALRDARLRSGPGTDTPVGPGDVIEVSVPQVKELAFVTTRVAGDGTISLPLLGTFRAGGHSEESVRQEIRTRLGAIMYDPQVTVFVREYKSRKVSVIGSVPQPGLYEPATPTDTIFGTSSSTSFGDV